MDAGSCLSCSAPKLCSATGSRAELKHWSSVGCYGMCVSNAA